MHKKAVRIRVEKAGQRSNKDFEAAQAVECGGEFGGAEGGEVAIGGIGECLDAVGLALGIELSEPCVEGQGCVGEGGLSLDEGGGDGLNLSGLDQLFDGVEVDFLGTEGEAMDRARAGTDGLATAGGIDRGADGKARGGQKEIRDGVSGGGELLGDGFSGAGKVDRFVSLEADNAVSAVEKGAAAAHNEDSGDLVFEP